MSLENIVAAEAPGTIIRIDGVTEPQASRIASRIAYANATTAYRDCERGSIVHKVLAGPVRVEITPRQEV